MPPKDRPLVDPTVYALAERFMSDHLINADAADATADLHEDATWDLADEIQHAVEDWIEDATMRGRIVEKA